MKYIINDNDRSPAYVQLYRQVREDIVGMVYPYGSKLPSKRLIADEVGISTVTVEHAYALLCDEGYVESRERSGYFVVFRRGEGFASTAFAPKGTYPHPHSATHNAHDLPDFPFSVLSRTMRRVLSDYGEALLDKSPNQGCAELRGAICDYLLRNRGIKATTEQIVIGSGAEYLYGLIVGLLGRERMYGIESPSYAKIEQVYRGEDVKYEPLPLCSDGIDSSALWKSTADVLHTTPYRSYPTGVTATASKRHEYIRWSSCSGRYIVEDDFESEFSVSAKPTETLFSMAENDNVIYLNTFSKTISPSLRVGYMVLPEHLVEVFKEKLGFYSCTVPTFEQFVLYELISGGDFERHINRVRRSKRRSER